MPRAPDLDTALELFLCARDRVGRNRVPLVSRNLFLALVALTLALVALTLSTSAALELLLRARDPMGRHRVHP